MMVVFALSVAVCLFGGTMADDPVSVMFTGSGSAGGLLGCKPRSTSSAPSARVRFQALRTGGVEYTRKLVPSERMTYSDVVATNSSSKNIDECAKTATEKKWDAFSFVNGQCVGYKIGDGICRCKTGDFVLYLTKGAIRSRSSAKAITAAKGRAAAAPTPLGFIRTTIYPTVNMTGDNFVKSSRSCEDVIRDYGESAPPLLHTANGKCYFTWYFSPYPCNDFCAGTATEVLLKIRNDTGINLLSKCGGTITLTLSTRDEYDNGLAKRTVFYSHEGYGCIPYPDPASDANCDITVLGPAGTRSIWLSTRNFEQDIDESPGVTCDGDELFLYPGPVDGSPCTKRPSVSTTVIASGDKATIRFQRKPAYNRGSVKRGFVVIVYAFDFVV